MISIHVWGSRALFTRPEMKAERVSYDVITPTAARGILEAIYWKPEMVWEVERIRVLNPIRFVSCKRNEVASKIPASNVDRAMRAGSVGDLGSDVTEDRVQRTSMLLRDVAYVIEARISLSAAGRANPSETVVKHVEMARRRTARGQCFHRPFLGCREFAADFELLDGPAPAPHANLAGERDLGWMLREIHYGPPATLKFFRPVMVDGIYSVPA